MEEHNHPEDNDSINANEVTNQAKQMVKNDLTKPIKRVYDDAVSAFAYNEEFEVLPDFSTVRSKLQRVRSSLLPTIPHDFNDVFIGNEWGENLERRTFPEPFRQ